MIMVTVLPEFVFVIADLEVLIVPLTQQGDQVTFSTEKKLLMTKGKLGIFFAFTER